MKKGQSVNLHRHEVSVVSAAYYIKVDKDSAGLNFKSPLDPYRMHEFFVKNTEYNIDNLKYKNIKVGYEIMTKKEALDIDDPIDLEFVRFLMKKNDTKI